MPPRPLRLPVEENEKEAPDPQGGGKEGMVRGVQTRPLEICAVVGREAPQAKNLSFV